MRCTSVLTGRRWSAIYEVYIDVLAVNNFFVDTAALTAVNIFTRRKIRPYRILAGAGAGTFFNCLVFAACGSLAVYLLSVYLIVNPLVVYFSFREKSGKQFLFDLGISYCAFLFLGGIVEWLYAGGKGVFPYEAAVLAAPLLLTAVIRWGRRQKWQDRCLEVCICQDGKSVCLQALIDSGNLLRDPYTGRAVSMIDKTVFAEAYSLAQAVRLIPYESLGCDHGLLPAVTAAELSFVYTGCTRRVPQAVLGLADHALFEKKPYQMIINPQELICSS